MLFRYRLVPLALLLAVAAPALGQAPRPLQENANQILANCVAREIDSSRALQNFNIDVWCQNGYVELRGAVADAYQRDEALRIAWAVPGVKAVASKLTLLGSGQIVRAQYEVAQNDPKVQPNKEPVDLVPPPRKVEGETQIQEPLPSFRAPGPPPPGAELPAPMPPYAWPSYAPYNNYSRVAYPVVYPKEAFPLIGPVYPFPKTPLGWHKVTLQYDDGHWWLQSHGGKRDWWTLRYW
jgi:hypothetical protein